jgi:hypothetical protein
VPLQLHQRRLSWRARPSQPNLERRLPGSALQFRSLLRPLQQYHRREQAGDHDPRPARRRRGAPTHLLLPAGRDRLPYPGRKWAVVPQNVNPVLTIEVATNIPVNAGINSLEVLVDQVAFSRI